MEREASSETDSGPAAETGAEGIADSLAAGPGIDRLGAEALLRRLEPLSALCVVEGTLVAKTSDGARVRLGAGEPLVVRSGDGVEIVRATAGAEALLFTCPGEPVGRLLGMLGVPERVPGDPVCVLPPRCRSARRIARLLLAAGDAPPASPPRAVDGLARFARWLDLVSAILEAEGAILAPRERRQAPSRREVRQAALELRKADPGLWNLTRFAARVGLSPRQVSRLFQDEMGMTFREYVTELRLERTRRLLARTDRSITEIALESGWRSLSHFTTVFRDQVGMTPRAYRRALGTGRVDACAARR